MNRLHLARLTFALFALGLTPLSAQDPAPTPAPTGTTAADVIKARAAAKDLHVSATQARLDAEKALDVAKIAEDNAAKAEGQADALLTRAIQQVGPVVVIADGKATVYELNPDGSLRVITPTPAESAPFNEDAPPTPAPAPPPSPPDPAPAPMSFASPQQPTPRLAARPRGVWRPASR